MTEIGRSIGWLDRKINSAEESKEFLEEMGNVKEKMAKDATSIDVDTGHYHTQTEVKVKITAKYSSFEKLPSEMLSNRDWDNSSIIQTSFGWKLKVVKSV